METAGYAYCSLNAPPGEKRRKNLTSRTDWQPTPIAADTHLSHVEILVDLHFTKNGAL